ncbi:MAG: hypothetical protein V7609_2621 [Verrucomicrobiota bacterium]
MEVVRTGREWSELGSRDIDGKAERPSERAQMSQWIPELGIYDYRHRMYHPQLGRFLQTDPTGFDAGDMNLFRYCGDDPVDHTDPMGLYKIIEKGLTPDQIKQLEEGQKTAADKLEKGASAVENGLKAGEDSNEFKAVKKDFEGVFHKPITTADMAKYAKDARDMVTKLRDDGKKGYFIVGKNQDYFAKHKLPHHPAAGVIGGKQIFINTDLAFKPETELGFSLPWMLGHEAAHNQGIPLDYYRNDPTYKTLSSQQALQNADSYMDFTFRQ